MNCSSVLVVGGGAVGRSAALALAGLGLDVSLIDAMPSAAAADDAVALRGAGVETRPDLELVGLVDVDSHVEAELSSGSVENFDAVVVAKGETRGPIRGTGSRRVAVVRSAGDAEAVARRLTGEAQSG